MKSTSLYIVAAVMAMGASCFAQQAAEVAPAQPAAAKPAAAQPAAADKSTEAAGNADAASDDADADKAPAIDADKAPAIPDLKLEFKPNSFQTNSYANYDDDGHVQNQSQNCSLYVKAFYNPAANPVGYSDLQITRVIADNGEKLSAPNNNNRSSYFNTSRSNNRPYFNFSLQLPFPPANATGFTEVSGKLTMQLGVGPIKRAVFPKMKDADGNRIHIEGLGDGKTDVWVKVSVQERGNSDNQQLRLEMTQDTYTQLSEAKVIMPQGDTVTLQNGGSSSNGTTTTRYYRTPITDDTRIVLEFYSKIKEVPATFSLYGLPLPGNPGRSEKDIVVKAVDAATASAESAGPANPNAPAGELKTVIEKAEN